MKLLYILTGELWFKLKNNLLQYYIMLYRCTYNVFLILFKFYNIHYVNHLNI